MTDTELYQIVKDHREVWPERVSHHVIREQSYLWYDDESYKYSLETMILAFEASFHRALLKRTASVRTESWLECCRVIVQHHEFEAPTLIEAYAKALEWLK